MNDGMNPRRNPSQPKTAQRAEPGEKGGKSGSMGEMIIGYIPAMRVFARALCQGTSQADDLVQEALLTAIENIDQFEPGTSLRPWLFTILRNRFYAQESTKRRGGEEHAPADASALPGAQFQHLRLRKTEAALQKMPLHYREPLILIAVLGESYVEAAGILACDIGTVKSRLNRARAALRDSLGDR